MATAQTRVSGGGPLSGVSTWWRRNQRKLSPYLFVSPFFLVFLVFDIYPIIYSFTLSFYKGFGFEEKTFFGLGNYIYMFQDARYIAAVTNTTKFAIGSVFILSPLALLVALGVNSVLVRWKDLYKTGLFFPIITAPIVIAVIFGRVMDTDYGLLNQFLGYLGIAPVGWITDKDVVIPSLVLVAIWTYLGINMLYWIAGLNGIDKQFYEAAAIDGANRIQTFFQITIPLLRPVILFVVIQAIIGSYNLFELPLVLTNRGGPSDGSLTITLYTYFQGFEYFNVGYASAIAYSMTVLLLVLSLINIRLFGWRGAGD